MYQEQVVLCGASSYEEKFYFNEDFSALPEAVRNELKIMCVLFVTEVGGTLLLEYEEDGSLVLRSFRRKKRNFLLPWSCFIKCFF